MEYRYVVDCDVAEKIFTLPRSHRDHFIKYFRQLADNPFQRGENSFCDSTGREIQKKRFGPWLISYWADHAVNEMRIVGIQKARPI